MWSSGSVVIPVYNSYNSLEELCFRLTKVLKEMFLEYEIILVDDNSKDDSFIKMKELHQRYDTLKIIRLCNNYGQQNAIMCGFEFATGDFIITMDDDLQHQPEELIKMMKQLEKGYDVVYGIAQNKQHGIFRNIGSKMTNILFNKICNKPRNIRVSSFRIIKKSILDKIIEDKTYFVYITAITLKITTNIGDVLVEHKSRKYGRSNYNFLKLLRLFLKLYIYYSNSILSRIVKKNKLQYIICEKYL